MTYTVIVAEDEELLLTNLVQKIQKADPDFLVAGTAQTGDQALALVEKLSPDPYACDGWNHPAHKSKGAVSIY